MNETDLRDCFAMFALNGIIARGGLHPELMPEDCIARRSYEIADAMIKARNAKDKSGIIAVKRSSTKKEK